MIVTSYKVILSKSFNITDTLKYVPAVIRISLKQFWFENVVI